MPSQTLNLFSSAADSPDNQGWQITSPRPAVAPRPHLAKGTGRAGGTALGLNGEYKVSAFGAWSHTVHNLAPDQTYRFTAYARSLAIVDIRQSLYASLTWLDADGKELRAPDYTLITLPDATDWSKLELITLSPPNAAAVRIQLGLRWSPSGTVWFDDVSLTPIDPPKQRTVKVASAFINLKPGDTVSSADSVARFVKLVDAQLPKNTDILCLPEGITLAGTGKTVEQVCEGVPGGPTLQTLSELARRHHTYIVAGVYETTTSIIFNTAVLIDREGKLVGKYHKTHLPQEEGTAGLTPGNDYPVFQTDFGKIGILICWDVQFPEAARALALQGAEIILLPIWGGSEILTRARAIENHVFLVSSSYHMKTMIIDPTGKSLAEAPSPEQGLISADINLDQQIFQPWLGDMKARTWTERRADISGRLSEIARSRNVAPTASQEPIAYTLNPTHPRVYTTAAELPELRRRALSTDKIHLDSLLAFYHEKARDAGPSGDYADTVQRLALLYLITEDKAHGVACVAAVEKLLDAQINAEYFPLQRRLKAFALAYDWCHDLMSEAFRAKIASACEAYVQAAFDSGEAQEDGGHLAGHVANLIPHFLAAGLAIGDEGNGRALITRSLRWINKAIPNWKFFLESASYQQSYPYTCTYVMEIATLFRLMETGLGQHPFVENPWFKNTIPWWLYALRSDETFFRYGDYFCSAPMLENGAYYRPVATIANRYGDPHAKWFAEQFRLRGKSEFDPLLFPAGDVPAQRPDDLPRTRYFQAMGIAIARGDWNLGLPAKSGDTAPGTLGAAGGTVAAFKCSPHYLHNHCHRDANSILLYHKGDLAIDSGLYDDYESTHWYNYYIRAIAHNTIVVHDPEEKFLSRGTQYANDGGQRFINEPHWSPRDYTDFIHSDAFKDGEILQYAEFPAHAYVCGNASNCYRKNKLTQFLRHVLFILDYPHKSAVSMLVLDELELPNPDLTPRFLLHTINEPTIAGNTVTNTHNAGRLTTTFLHPSAIRIEKIGGPGKDFLVDGNNYPPIRIPAGPHTPGSWRIEASPTAPARTQKFLTLLTPTDIAAAAPPAPTVEQPNPETWIVRQGGLTVALYKTTPPKISGERTILIQLATIPA